MGTGVHETLILSDDMAVAVTPVGAAGGEFRLAEATADGELSPAALTAVTLK
jgi:hypothetical protein